MYLSLELPQGSRSEGDVMNPPLNSPMRNLRKKGTSGPCDLSSGKACEQPCPLKRHVLSFNNSAVFNLGYDFLRRRAASTIPMPTTVNKYEVGSGTNAATSLALSS